MQGKEPSMWKTCRKVLLQKTFALNIMWNVSMAECVIGIWYLKHSSPKINYLYVWFPPIITHQHIHHTYKKNALPQSLVITTNQLSTNPKLHLGTFLWKLPTPFEKYTTLGCQCWISRPLLPNHPIFFQPSRALRSTKIGALIPAGLGKKRWPLCCNRSNSKVAASRLAAARTCRLGR